MNTVHASPRFFQLDVLRGVAILGLLLLNISAMGFVALGYVNFSPILLSDQIVDVVNALLFDGRFRSLFSLLFGIGLFLQMQKLTQDGMVELSPIKSRLKWLLVFGILHCTFIWAGDILIIYALSGLFILKYIHLPTDKMLNTAIKFIAVGLIILLLEGLLGLYFDEQGDIYRNSETFLSLYQTISLGYFEYLSEQIVYTLANIIFFPIYMFYFSGVMLLGVALYKKGLFSVGLSNSQLHILVKLIIFVSVLDALCRWYYPLTGFYLVMSFSSLSGLLMAIAITHYIVKYMNDRNVIYQLLAKTGRLAFTLYILQSIVMVTLFRFITPELLLTFTRTDYLLMACAFILIQLAFSFVYFQIFNIGPLEKLWRLLIKKRDNKLSIHKLP